MEHQNSAPTASPESSYASMAVDPFLVEALQNPRHRLTILRMELDIQRFIQNSEQHQFEFQHFPTSYLRLAAHRVAQHYGLQTMVLDNFSDGQGTRILVRKLAETKSPAVCLSDVPTRVSEHEKHEHVKMVLKPRLKASCDGTNEEGKKCNSIRTVEERKEEYDKARARIFSPQSSSGDENVDLERNGDTYRVAILRDREKDLIDPDYDRSYERYVPASPGYNLLPVSVPKFQPPLGYAVYMPWPSHSMMYAHTYDQFRHNVFQPLSFDCSQNR